MGPARKRAATQPITGTARADPKGPPVRTTTAATGTGKPRPHRSPQKRPMPQRAKAPEGSVCPVGTCHRRWQSAPKVGSETSGGRGQCPPRRLSDRDGHGTRPKASGDPAHNGHSAGGPERAARANHHHSNRDGQAPPPSFAAKTAHRHSERRAGTGPARKRAATKSITGTARADPKGPHVRTNTRKE